MVPYSSGKDGLSWVTTAGLGKFGLPNLECRDVPPHVTESIAEVMNAIAHQLVARVLERPAADERDLVLEDEFTIEGACFVRLRTRACCIQLQSSLPRVWLYIVTGGVMNGDGIVSCDQMSHLIEGFRLLRI